MNNLEVFFTSFISHIVSVNKSCQFHSESISRSDHCHCYRPGPSHPWISAVTTYLVSLLLHLHTVPICSKPSSWFPFQSWSKPKWSYRDPHWTFWLHSLLLTFLEHTRVPLQSLYVCFLNLAHSFRAICGSLPRFLQVFTPKSSSQEAFPDCLKLHHNSVSPPPLLVFLHSTYHDLKCHVLPLLLSFSPN